MTGYVGWEYYVRTEEHSMTNDGVNVERDWDNTDDESIHNDVRCAICDERIITNRYGHYQEEVGEFIGKYGDGVTRARTVRHRSRIGSCLTSQRGRTYR